MDVLENVRILDLTNVLAGPFATVQLSLLGAEVIKIERPQRGDLARKLGASPELSKKLMGASFIAQNANKKSLTLNLKAEEGKEIFYTLVKTADVVVENFRPGIMKRLMCDYESLKTIKPDLIYCAISGFGQTGPLAKRPAYDQIIQGMSGVMAINGTPELNPLRCGFPVCDTVGGLTAAFAIVSALYYREKTGEGQFIDVALLDSIMPLMGWVVSNWLLAGQPPQLMGNDNFTAAPSGTFRTQDGYINISANEQKQFESLCDVLGLPHLKTDPRFQEREARKVHRKALTERLEEVLTTQPTHVWVEKLTEAGVPSGEIFSLQDALKQPQILHRKTMREIEVPKVGKVSLFNTTAKFSKTPGMVKAPPPSLGEHTETILKELGYHQADIQAFREKGVI